MLNDTELNNTNKREFVVADFYLYPAIVSLCGGLPANIFIFICCIYFIRSQCIHNSAPALYHYFVLSITAADILFLLSYASPLFLKIYFNFDLTTRHPIVCLVTVLSTYLSMVSSSIGLLFLNMDKFLAIVKPLHHTFLLTKRRVILAISLCWAIAVCWSALFTFGPFTYADFLDQCYVKMDPPAYVTFSVSVFIAPIFIAGVLSGAIAIVAFKAIRDGGTGNIRQSVRKGRPGNHGVAKLAFVFSTTVWSCISCLPYRILYIVTLFENNGEVESDVQISLMRCFYILLTLHPAGNPVVTLATQRRYGAVMKQMYRKMRFRKDEGDSGKGAGRISRISTIVGTVNTPKMVKDS